MAEPASRAEFKDYCLRKLGFPVLEINVDDDQIEDSIDDALQYYRMRHYDGTELAYMKHLFTCLLYTSPSPRDRTRSRMPSSA